MIAGGTLDPTGIAQGVRAVLRGGRRRYSTDPEVLPRFVRPRTLLKGVYYYEDEFRFGADSPCGETWRGQSAP
jgi:hypothetical protein